MTTIVTLWYPLFSTEGSPSREGRWMPAAEFAALLASRDALAERVKRAVELLKEARTMLDGSKHIAEVDEIAADGLIADITTFLKEPA